MATNSMDNHYYGQPFVWESTKATENFGDMDSHYYGQPFVTVPLSAPPPSAHKIKTINYTSLTLLDTAMEVSISDLKSYGGVED